MPQHLKGFNPTNYTSTNCQNVKNVLYAELKETPHVMGRVHKHVPGRNYYMEMLERGLSVVMDENISFVQAEQRFGTTLNNMAKISGLGKG